jgi:1,4-alpha-glucan branching enzyme
MLSRLENHSVPFRLGLVFSPLLCGMLRNEGLLCRYLAYLDKKIEFGKQETERRTEKPERDLARYYYEADVERRILFTEVCEMDILGVLNRLQKRGRLEILSTAASYAFLPVYTPIPALIHAQIETALLSHRRIFGKAPRGFWLPEFGWTGELEEYLRSYGFSYTMVSPHGLVLGKPQAERGSFCGVKSLRGLCFLGRDHYAEEDLTSLRGQGAPVYRDSFSDIGFELPLGDLEPFVCAGGKRCPTGYHYRNRRNLFYDPEEARNRAAEGARLFLARRVSRLEEAGRYMEGDVLCLCAFDADRFGLAWYEGMIFLEELLRSAAASGDLELLSPQDYLDSQDPGGFQTVLPEFSSWEEGGYAETWLDASNDWIYRHIFRAARRMVEVSGRFPNDTGLKERALNQAARELLLAMGSDWPKMLRRGINSEYAGNQIEEALKNFTDIYETLGSNYISTEWFTALEKRHPVFPFINYRVFAKKK